MASVQEKQRDHRGAAVVTGAGPGLGASVCRRLSAAGFDVVGLVRNPEDAGTDGYRLIRADVADPKQVGSVFSGIRERHGPIRVLVHNAGFALIKPFDELSPDDMRQVWEVTCLGAMACASEAVPDMLANGGGVMVFTGATASIRGGARFAAFASAKFALRGLTQSLAREFGPQGIHVAHVLVDGLIWGKQARERFEAARETCLEPDAIAETYLHLIDQHRSCWTQELDLRPDCEKF